MTVNSKLIERLAPWIAVVVLVMIWEVTVRLFNVPSFIFPGALETAQALITYAGPIGQHSWQTFWTTLIGFGLGVAVGLVLGFIIGSSRFLYNACYPLLVGFNAIPKVAFVPILVVWFGIGSVPAILTAFLICFFPIARNGRRAASTGCAAHGCAFESRAAAFAAVLFCLVENRHHPSVCGHRRIGNRRL